MLKAKYPELEFPPRLEPGVEEVAAPARRQGRGGCSRQGVRRASAPAPGKGKKRSAPSASRRSSKRPCQGEAEASSHPLPKDLAESDGIRVGSPVSYRYDTQGGGDDNVPEASIGAFAVRDMNLSFDSESG